ncbi:MAG TPA: PIG-L family deacetylase [Candidatus Eisenbacteria bacterium]|nr:PIG-L family deacetylase [Candidatus Eisenbacteria bacterium]
MADSERPGNPTAGGPLRLLAVLAHPDDESLGLGGALAKYAAEGVEVSLVTATRGEGGRYHEHRDGPEHPGRQRLGEIREAELRAAADVLGIGDVSILGYPDGALDQVDAREIHAAIAAHIRRLRPHVVITFPPDGAYGHPDHIAICQFTTAAVTAAADAAFGDGAAHAVPKLYYFVNSEARMGAYESAFKKLTSKVDGVERFPHPWPEWEITTWIETRAQADTVWKAIFCHESQISVFDKLRTLSPEHHDALWGTTEFYRAMSLVNGGRRRETDLFEGLRP